VNVDSLKQIWMRLMSVLQLVISELSSQNTEQNTTDGTNNESKRYKFRGKVFECGESIIRQLNLALAYNQSQERYEEVKSDTTTKSRDSKGSD